MTVIPEGVRTSSVQVDRILGTATGTQPTAIVSLTDNTGGTANDTIAAIPDPADAPGTADILRDDLVANTLPEIRNAIADLAAKQNEVLAALRAVGGIAT